MFHRITLTLTLLFILAHNPADAQQQVWMPADSVSYEWPTDATRYLSSTFGETRSAHLHAGIDIRTWGREGYRVFASRDGYIYRIGIGPHGYGHVIYMKHNDGSFTVYAHLNRFEESLQAYADSIRFIDYSYEIDLRPEKRFTYQKGDLIAFTGSTGVGPPHLHFEIRDPGFNPINPLLTDIRRFVLDELPPVFTQLAIEHLDDEHYRFQKFETRQATGNGSHYEFGEIRTSNPIGLAVNVHDRANRTPNSYAVHSLMVIHESDTLFHSVKDGFAFRETADMFVDRSYPILAQTRRGFQRLFVTDGNRLPIYRKAVNRGVLLKDEGSYPLRIVAKDIYGNRSEARVTVTFENTSAPDEITSVAAYPNPLPDPAGKQGRYPWIELTVNPEESLFASAGGPEMTPEPEFRDIILRFGSRRSVEKTVAPGRLEQIHTPDQKIWVTVPPGALYDTLNTRMEVIHSPNQIDIEFSQTRLPLKQPVYFNLILPEEFRDRDGLALFSVDPHRNRESFLSSNISDGMVRARMRQITNLRIRQDRIAPWVGRPQIEKNLAGLYIVKLPVVDQDTGIAFRNSTITVNGERGIIEYDPEKNVLIYYNPEFRPERENQIEYNVLDGAGNRTSRTVTVQYQPS